MAASLCLHRASACVAAGLRLHHASATQIESSGREKNQEDREYDEWAPFVNVCWNEFGDLNLGGGAGAKIKKQGPQKWGST